MNEQFVSLAYDLLSILLPLLVLGLVELIRRRLGTERMRKIQKELDTKQDLALLAVRFTEQAYRDAGGPQKYNQAANWLAKRAQDRGIKITEDEVQGLIEAALRMIKDEFGEQWASAVEEE